jgi:hypothetical protein
MEVLGVCIEVDLIDERFLPSLSPMIPPSPRY